MTGTVCGDIFLASNKYVVGNPSKQVVALTGRDHRSEAVFEVISSGRFQADPVRVKKGPPKYPSKPIYMAVERPTGVVPSRNVNNALYWKAVNSSQKNKNNEEPIE